MRQLGRLDGLKESNRSRRALAFATPKPASTTGHTFASTFPRARLFHGVMRQGFIVQKGSKSITSFEDLVPDDLTYINRQAGAGNESAPGL